MPLYYLNWNPNGVTFYTDSGSLGNVLAFANQNELISVPYLLGRNRRTNKLMFLRNKSCSAGINSALRNFLPASIQRNFILDSGIVAEEFVVQFENGNRVYTDKEDVIVQLKRDDKLSELLEAFEVPLSVCPTLLDQSGTLISVVRRTETYLTYGNFQRIEDWLNLKDTEKGIANHVQNLN